MSKRLPVAILLLLVSAAALTIRLSSYGYADQDRTAIMAPATAGHPSGTDMLGRDRAVRVAAAFLLGLAGASIAAAITTAIATGFGLLAAFSPRSIASFLLFVSDAFLSLPWLFLLMMARSILPLTATPVQTAVITFLVLAVLGWPACARAIYRGAAMLRASEWMLHGYACGLKTPQLVRLHVMPHLRSLMLPQFLVSVPAFLMAEANLGALGLGVGEPLPSWGAMLLELNNSALLARSHWVYLPIVVLIFMLLVLDSLTTEAEANA